MQSQWDIGIPNRYSEPNKSIGDERPRSKLRGIKSKHGEIIRRKRWGIRPKEIELRSM